MDFIWILILLAILAIGYKVYNKNDHVRNLSREDNDEPYCEHGNILAARKVSTQKEVKHIKENIVVNKEYVQIMAGVSPFHNLNYDTYIFSAKYVETNKMRTNKEVKIFKGMTAESGIRCLGYTEPMEYHRAPVIPPSQKQLEVLRDRLNKSIPSHLSSLDATALITRILDNDSIPNPQLLEYATQMRIPISYYIGKKELYSTIFANLSDRDQYMFFVFCVYRSLTKDYSIENPLQSPHRATFYDFADQYSKDEAFLRSVKKIHGEDLRFFGTRNINGYSCQGGSKNTTAYKVAKSFLEDRHLVNRT